MTREEFESILEEVYIEGYNTAIEDIQEDILDEEAYDLENEYEVYAESRKPQYAQASRALRYAKKGFGIPEDDQFELGRQIRNGNMSSKDAYNLTTKGKNLHQRLNMNAKANEFLRKNNLTNNRKEVAKDELDFIKHGGRRKW